MAHREPTMAEWAAEEARLFRIRGERVQAQEAAAKEEEKARAERVRQTPRRPERRARHLRYRRPPTDRAGG
jgi:hypothetical protein